MKKELQEKEEEMNKKMNEAIIKERKTLTARQKMEMENLRKQQLKEIDVIYKFILKIIRIVFFADNS